MAWEVLTDMPTVWAHVTCAAYQGKIYVHRWNASSSVIQVYDPPPADSWDTISLPDSANVDQDAGLCADDDFLYFLGGQNGTSVFETVDCWAWDGGSWNAIADLPDARRECPAASDGTTQVIVGSTEQVLNGSWRDNFWTRTSGAWSAGTVIPEDRNSTGYRIAAVDGLVYVPAGELGPSPSPRTDRLEIGTIGGGWTTGADLSEAIDQFGMSNDDAHLYVVGGNDGTGSFEAVTRRYTIATDTWDTLDALPEGRQLNDCAVVGDYLYCIGGATGASGVGGDGATMRLFIGGGMHVGYVAMG